MNKKIKISNCVFYLTMCLFPVLPVYFRLIPSLMMYSALGMICVVICFSNGRIGNIKQLRFLGFYTICCMTCYLYHGELNEIIKLLIAPIGLFLVMLKMIDSEKKFYKVIDLIIFTGGVVCLIGIIQEFTGYNLFSLLNNSGYQEAALSARMGLYRIYTSFLMPINYGNYLMVILSLVLYRLNTKDCTYKSQFKIIQYLLFANLVFTGSRAPLIASIVLYILFLVKSGTSKMTIEIIKMMLVIVFSGVVGLVLGFNIFSSVSNMFNMILGLFNSKYMSNISVDFGGNVNGIGDRTRLYAWVWDYVKNDFLFGIGRVGKESFVIMRNQWSTKTSVENEYLATLLIYGFVGLFGELSFFFSCLKKAFLLKRMNNPSENIPFGFVAFHVLIAYLLVFFTVSLQMDERIFFVFIGLVICYKNISKTVAA